LKIYFIVCGKSRRGFKPDGFFNGKFKIENGKLKDTFKIFHFPFSTFHFSLFL